MKFREYLGESDTNLVKRLEDLSQTSEYVDFTYSDISNRDKKNDKKLNKLISELVKDYDFNIDDKETAKIQKEIQKLIKN